MPNDPAQLAHLEWLGYVQPMGLVVSVPVLLAAQAQVNRNIVPDHQQFLACLRHDRNDEVLAEMGDFSAFTQQVLGWEPTVMLREGLSRVVESARAAFADGPGAASANGGA